jgi:rod shape-determining protein MreB
LLGFRDIGIDLGTASVLVYMKRQRNCFKEPSVISIDKNTGEVLAVGEEARSMLGRTPGNIIAAKGPLSGV